MNLPPTKQMQSGISPSPTPFKYAQVVFNLPLRDPFTYEIPPHFQGLVQKGMRVFAPFGRRKLTGYVVSLTNICEKDISLKAIEDLPDAEPILSKEILSLTRWMADYYQTSWGEAIRAALPAGLEDESREHLTLTEKGLEALESGDIPEHLWNILETLRKQPRITPKQLQNRLKKKYSAHTLARLKTEGWVTSEIRIKRSSVGYSYEKIARLTPLGHNKENADLLLSRSPKQKIIYHLLYDQEKKVSDLRVANPSCSEPLRKLRDKGLVEIITLKTPRLSDRNSVDSFPIREEPLTFTPKQEDIYQNLGELIDAGEFRVCLLHGVTGSGKTEVYIRCIHRALELGKTAIMLVPEISLTPQTVNLFRRRFGDEVAILHSGLSDHERYQEWKRIHDDGVSIVVGARSAVFAPFKNLGVVIIDEEHDPSYKQDSTPRYHGRDTAIVRAREQRAVVILGSATPSLETRRNAESGKYSYFSLEKRIQDRLLPLVIITDMIKEKSEKKNFSMFSGALKAGIRERLERKEQVFLFLNRRGTANYVFCTECGFVYHCRRCSVSLTFHGREKTLRCHYCNYRMREPSGCAECGGEVFRFKGFGTQKIEEEVKRLFPEARIFRLDRDTTRTYKDFESMYQKMTSRTIDILIGTQMITKGHDFPNVTLVGVIHADLSLNIPDFRSGERSFQLLTQVAGRAGRGKVPGQVILQTQHPKHYVYHFVRDHDFERFYAKELSLREQLNYPPFTRLVALEIESKHEPRGEALVRKLKGFLLSRIKNVYPVEILGPSRAALYRINNKFRWHIILRAREVLPLQSILNQCRDLPEFQKAQPGGVRVSIDVDPVNLL